MGYSSIKRFSVIGALSVTALLGVYAGWLFYSHSETPSDDLSDLHSLLLTTLVATWVVADAQESRRAHPTFDHGSFVFMAFPFYVPYYLISTRRWRRGLLILGGVVLLFMLPWLTELFVWLVEVFVWMVKTLAQYVRLLISYVR